jgi:hypothetical protein
MGSDLWDRVTAVSPPASQTVVLLTLAAVLVVLGTPLWRPARHLLTIVHEGAHAAVAVLVGRRLAGVRLHADTSGLTLSVGRPRGPGMIATALAGYPGPSVVGLGCAWLVGQGRAAAVPAVLLIIVGLLALAVRNLYGLWSVLVVGAALVGATVLDPQPVAHALVWFLLLGAPRAVLEMAASRRRSRQTDADVLARLTHMPAVVWVGVMFLLTTGAAALGAWWSVT